MKLVFYGGGDWEDNRMLDKALLELPKNRKPRITYIPSCSYDADVEFREFVDQYAKFNVTKFLYFPIDIPYRGILLEEVLQSDIIHLSGGNTFYFLNHLRKSGLLKELKGFVERGGILTGLSAGAIIMTPTIETANFPYFDKDHNEENLKNLSSMGLVNFEFFPHYRNSKRYDRELKIHSRKIDYPLYACPDGSGIIVNDDSIRFVGKAFCFFRGTKVAIKSA